MVSVCTSSFKELFSFKLFGIFVNVSNKKPPLHKAGGTLTAIIKKMTADTKRIFETKIGYKQCLLSVLRSFYIFPIYYICIYGNKSNDNGLTVIGILSIMFGIIAITLNLKTFHLYEDKLIVKRPLFLFKQNVTFKLDKISKIIFIQKKSKISGGPYIVIQTDDGQKEFLIFYFGEILSDFISRLKTTKIEIIIEKDFKI